MSLLLLLLWGRRAANVVGGHNTGDDGEKGEPYTSTQTLLFRDLLCYKRQQTLRPQKSFLPVWANFFFPSQSTHAVTHKLSWKIQTKQTNRELFLPCCFGRRPSISTTPTSHSPREIDTWHLPLYSQKWWWRYYFLHVGKYRLPKMETRISPFNLYTTQRKSVRRTRRGFKHANKLAAITHSSTLFT